MNQDADQRGGEPTAELPDGGGPTIGACDRRCPCGQRTWRECPGQPGWSACQRTISNQSVALGGGLGIFLNIPLLIAIGLIFDPFPLVDWGYRVSRAMGVSEAVGFMSVMTAYLLFLPSVFSALAYFWLKRRSLTAKKMEVKTAA